MKRLFPSTLAGIAASVLMVGAADAKTFEVDGKTYDPGKVISDAEANGSLTKEQAAKFREDEKKIADKEQKDKDKRKGNLSTNEQKSLARKLDDLMKKIEKVRTAKADNTQRNVGDQRKESMTPEKQSQDKNDIKMLGSIRRKLMADKSLSTNAKNVKVICNKGEVTLRGPVDTAEEKARVEAAVSAAAGNAKVQSELEVLKK